MFDWLVHMVCCIYGSLRTYLFRSSHLQVSFKIGVLNPKKAESVNLTLTVVFPKICFSEIEWSPGFLGLFNIIVSDIFPENFIEIPHLVQKIRRFSSSILTIFVNVSDILTFSCCKETNDVSIQQMTLAFFFNFNLL